MKKVIVKNFLAKYGDSFFINIEYKNKSYNILIDCGFKDTYINYIRKELDNINTLDLLVLTHIDDDHINGAIELLKDNALKEKMELKNIWFNDLYKIVKNKFSKHKINSDIYAVDKEEVFSEEIGFKRAKTLSNYIYESKYNDVWNKHKEVIQCEKMLYEELYPIDKELKFVLLSPTVNNIEDLLNKWIKEFKIDMNNLVIDNKILSGFYGYFNYHDRYSEIFNEECSNNKINIEELAEKEFLRNSVENNSSIAFFIEVDEERFLFLGDANSKDIKKSLRQYKEVKGIERIKFNLVKLSHHGSKFNIDSEFFELFYSDKYLISTNGDRHNHPDIECISKIVVKQKEFKKLYFNYNIKKIIKIFEDEELKKKYNYEIIMPEENNEITNIEFRF